MDNTQLKYSFRRRDYPKIRNWYQLSKKNYTPLSEEYLKPGLKQNEKTFHYHLQFKTITLDQVFINENVKDISQISNVVILSSLYRIQEGVIVTVGKEITMQCQFSIINFTIDFKGLVAFFFYIQDKPSNYQLFLEIQMINKQGQFKKIGACRFPLPSSQNTSLNAKFSIINNLFNNNHPIGDQKEIVAKRKSKSKLKQKRSIVQVQTQIGYIQVTCNLQGIKQIQKFLPPLNIIDMATKVAPLAVGFNRKNGQISIDASFKITVSELMVRIQQPKNLKSQLLINNPFTLSHKQMVEFEIKEYRMIIDIHNGWKFFNQKSNERSFDLVVEKEHEIYLSFRNMDNKQKIYYEGDSVLLIALCVCKVEFTLNGITNQKRTKEFLLGWLPLPLDLSLKQNRIEMLMVNDIQFPFCSWPLLNLKCMLTSLIIHPQYQKYKPLHDDKKTVSHQSAFPLQVSGRLNNYFLPAIRKTTTEATSQGQIMNKYASNGLEIQILMQALYENQMKYNSKRFVNVMGRGELGQSRKRHQTQISMQSTVGKVLKVSLEISSLVPQTNCPSIYYLPRNMKGVIYFLREARQFDFAISEETVKFQIPVRISSAKTVFVFKNFIDSVYQFNETLNSKITIALFEEDTDLIYAKVIQDTFEVLGAGESDKVLLIRLTNFTEYGNKIFGSLLLNVSWQLEKQKLNDTNIEEYEINKSINSLSKDQRIKMRIGNFKGDSEVKTKTVSIIKDRKRNQLIANIVDHQLSCDGEIVFEIGADRYHLIEFTNLDQSENNVFTFHLDSSYAQLVTNQLQYRTIVQTLNVQILNFHKLQFIYHQTQSYYQATLRYNQSIGLLIKMNASEYCDATRNLTKIELLIKRNTLETKKFKLKCKYKSPFIWDVYGHYEVYEKHNQEPLRVRIKTQFLQQYRDIIVLNPQIKYDPRSKEIVFIKHGIKKYSLLVSAYLKEINMKVMIIYNITFVQGQILAVQAGQKYAMSVPLQLKCPITILRSHQRQVTILNVLKLKVEQNEKQDIIIQCLIPTKSKIVLISCYDISGIKQCCYGYKVESKLCRVLRTSQIDTRNTMVSVVFENPYACLSQFTIFSSHSAVAISQTKLQLEGYATKILICSLIKDCDQKCFYIYVLDINGNVIHTTQLTFNTEQHLLNNFV